MIRFEQTFGAHAGRVLEFDQDCIACGRLPDLDVSFDPNADLDASGRHAEIRRSEDGWVLVDIGSRNGTFVQGRRISRHLLRDGEEVEFGSGGPRLRVRLATTPRLGSEGYAAAGAATGAATPIERTDATGKAATMLAPSGPTPQWIEPTADRPLNRLPPTDRPPPPEVAPLGGAIMPPAAMPMAPPVATSPPAEAGERRYGERTVGLMIGSALGRAGLGAPQDGGQKPAVSAGLWVAMGCLAMTVVGLALALAAVLVVG